MSEEQEYLNYFEQYYGWKVESEHESRLMLRVKPSMAMWMDKTSMKNVQDFGNSIMENTLQKAFPNLIIGVYHPEDIDVWVKGSQMSLGRCHISELPDLNKQAEQILSGKMFYCSCCQQFLNIECRVASVFAGHYCDECAINDPKTKRLIQDSKSPNFYD